MGGTGEAWEGEGEGEGLDLVGFRLEGVIDAGTGFT